MAEENWLTLMEVKATLKGTDVFSFHAKMGYAMVEDTDGRIKRLFLLEGDKFLELGVKTMVKKIAAYLSQHVTLEKLLEDKLLHEPLETLLQLSKRADAKGEVKEHKGCYYLTVKGEKGPALKLEL